QQQPTLEAGILLGILKFAQTVSVSNKLFRNRIDSIHPVFRGSQAAVTDHRVIATPGKGMAPQKPPPGFNSSLEGAESLHRLHGIFGAGWNKATGGRQHRREKPFIST